MQNNTASSKDPISSTTKLDDTELGKISDDSFESLLVIVISDLKEDVCKDINSRR